MIGTKKYGVWTIEDLKDRCSVDEITECWNWKMGKTGEGSPSIWSPTRKIRTNVGGIFSDLMGKPPKGKYWYAKCGNKQCCNPNHRVQGTRKQQMRTFVTSRPALSIAKMTATKRAQGKLSEADVHDIVNGGMKLKEIVEKYGICMQYASMVRSGKARAPLMASGASAFSWRP